MIEQTDLHRAVNGKLMQMMDSPLRVESCEHTWNHMNCPACQAAEMALRGNHLHLAEMEFKKASEHWINMRAQSTSLKIRTHEATRTYISALNKFFGSLRLSEITPGHLRGYQLARLANTIKTAQEEMHPWKCAAKPTTVNHELSVLGQMLTHCRLWHRLRPYYFPLHVSGWSPRSILSEKDEAEFWQKAAKHPEASLAYWVALITNNTTASGIELRGLRLKHVYLRDQGIARIYIPEDAVKNNSRPRMLALNPTARWAVEQCYKRALELGCCEPNHYLFPFRAKRNLWDPTRPASRSWLRKSWQKLRVATGFSELNPHDLRHHCITRMLENGVEPETVRAIAGHVTEKMMGYYAHQRTRVKYAAVMAIDTPPGQQRRT